MKNQNRNIPRLPMWLIHLLVVFSLEEGYSGDIVEEYGLRIKNAGKRKADRWVWCQALGAIPSVLRYYILWSMIMFKNYLKIALRNIRRQKLHSLLNIIGLAVGIAVCILILFHVKDELSYDRHLTKADRIYRVTERGNRHFACVASPFGILVKEEIPEIEAAARFFYMKSTILKYSPLGKAPRIFEEERGFFADAGVIPMFDLAFIQGNLRLALEEPDTIILTASMAKKYFGDENPIGKTLGNDYPQPWRVTGVLKDSPKNTHFRFDFLVSMSTVYKYYDKKIFENRDWNAFYTYIQLKEGASMKQLEPKLLDFFARFHSNWGSREEVLGSVRPVLQPVADIHLHSHLEKEFAPNSHAAYVYVYSLLAFFILLIAGANFVNITTAQAFKRMKEVGVRKVVGAQKRQLIFQFMGEAFLLSFAAALSALLLVRLFLPLYDSISGKALEFQHLLTLENIAAYVVIFVLLAGLAGFYPALFMASFKPVSSLKGVKLPRGAAAKARNWLVLFQFVMSIIMIFCTLTIYKQMNYLQKRNLGFNKEQLLAVRLYRDLKVKLAGNAEVLKNELMRYPGISQMAAVSKLPGERLGVEDFRIEGTVRDGDLPNFRFMRADEGVIEAMNLQMVAGKSFAGLSPGRTAFIINESAARILNLENPVGKMAVNSTAGKGEILGVVKDFNFASLHFPVEPLVIDYRPRAARYLLIKINGARIPEALEYTRQSFKKIAPGSPLIYRFVDDYLNHLYRADHEVGRIFKYFSFLAIFIACMGLFGLSIYSAELRVKEIGIRKVFGASVPGVVRLLSCEFIRWVFLANFIAWPAAFYAMHRWLQGFAYRTGIGLSTFILSGIVALLIAFVTVSFQGLKAAVANPADSLRYE